MTADEAPPSTRPPEAVAPVFPDAAISRSLRRDALAVAALALALLVWRRETLFLPGYQDQSSGPWTEAKFLADSSFNYYALRYEVNHYMDFPPGPRCYMISVLPTLLALWMKLVPDVTFQIAGARVASFLCGALTVVLLYRVIRSWAPRTGALAVCAAFATLPSFVTQVEIMGMDVPLAPLMLLSLTSLMQHRFAAAAAWAAVAFAVKASGMLAVLVAIAYLAMLWILGRGRIDPGLQRAAARAFGLNAALLAAIWAVVLWGDTSLQLRSTFPWPRLLKPPLSIVTQTPELGVLALVAALSAAMRIGPRLRAIPRGDVRERLVEILLKERAVVVSWIALAGLVLASGVYMYTSRYAYCVMSLLFLVVAREFFARPRWAGWTTTAACAMAAFNLANASGAFYPSPTTFGRADFDRIPGLTTRLCVFTERSREYLADHRSNIRALAALNAQPLDTPIFAPVPYLFLMRNPAAGYVDRPLRAYDATRFETAIQQFLDLYAPESGEPCPVDPAVLYYGDSRVSVPKPGPRDAVLYRDDLDPPLLIYAKRIPPELRGDRDALEQWYLDESWDSSLVGPRFRVRADYLLRRGLADRFARELRQALTIRPDDAQLKIWIGLLDSSPPPD
jgi:hypothetical protein